MDAGALATAVVGLLVPYLGQVGDRVAAKFADRAATTAEGAIQRLYLALKARLRPGSYEAGQLEGLEAKPDSPARQQALASTLAEYLAEHPGMIAELEDLLVVAQQAGVRVQAIHSGITAGGDAHVQAGGDITGRDRTGNDRPANDRMPRPPSAGL
jgi:hypothetical protein